MPYININEYDYTIHGPVNYNGNIVAIPINSSDGPADRWVTVHSYDDFVQMFGPNPNTTNGIFGNSWEYAANLLLKGMSVCVRRITHVLDEETGVNTNEMLPYVNTASTLVKVKDIIGNNISVDSYETENIYINDSSNRSILTTSYKGEPQDNPRYRQYLSREDGNDVLGAYPNTYALQMDNPNTASEENPIIDNMFADVISTNSEWEYKGPYLNPHYKFVTENVPVSMEYIYKMHQTVSNDGEGEPYVEGDFFIAESNHIVKFTSIEYPNPNLISNAQYRYPDDLRKLDTTSLTTNNFVYVTYDKTNTDVINQVWTYSETGTIVNNHKFINGDITIDNITEYKAHKSKSSLPSDVETNSFAVVQKEDNLYIYESNKWKTSSIPVSSLLDSESEYSLSVNIPFICTGKSIDTDIYKHYLHWKDIGESKYVDDDNPEITYLPTLYWINTNNEINTRPHKVLAGGETNINTIVINKNADTTKTKFNLQINGYKDIIIDEDNSDTRLVSGAFGFTNNSTESIKIYGFKVQQKDLDGNLFTEYDSNLENIINANGRITASPLLEIYNETYEIKLDDPIPKLDDTTSEDKWYIELEPKTTIHYNKDITNGVFTLKVAGYDTFNIDIHTYSSSSGRYDFILTNKVDNDGSNLTQIVKNHLPIYKSITNSDVYNAPLNDGLGNFNLFAVEYVSPGTAGNNLNVRLRTIVNQGIYLYVYKHNQRLEKIELCSFRYRNGNTGRVDILDMNNDKNKIWKSIISKFGIRISSSNIACDFNLVPLTDESELGIIKGKYVNVSINKKIIHTISVLDYVTSLYAQSENVINQLMNGRNPDDEHVKHEVVKSYIPLMDKYKYNITFVSNGGYVDKITYPKNVTLSFGTNTGIRLIEDALLEVAETRKDCVAYLDVPYDLPVEDVPNYFEHISSSYAAAYSPWAYMKLPTGSIKWMPPSFVQLYAHARSISNGNKMYLPPAGVKRAQVGEIIETNHDISSKYLTAWQNNDTVQYINPIIWINGYDFTVYGQKTLYNMVDGSRHNESALQDLNVRLITNHLKKLIFRTCIELTFELNNILTWNEFKSKIEPTLSVMQGEGVLTDYEILMGTETMTSADLNSGHIVGTVRISVARAVTDWDINFELTPNNVTFTGLDYNSTY